MVEDLNELLRGWWIWNESFFNFKKALCLGLKWMLEDPYLFPPLSAFYNFKWWWRVIWTEIELLDIIKWALNTVKMSWKLAIMEFFHHMGWLMHMSRLMGSTSVTHNRKWLFVILAYTAIKVDSIGCASQKIVCCLAPFDMSQLVGLTQFYKYYFFLKYTSKNYKIFSNRSQIFCSCSWGFRIRTW